RAFRSRYVVLPRVDGKAGPGFTQGNASFQRPPTALVCGLRQGAANASRRMSLRLPLDPTAVEETVFDALIAAREKYGDKEILEDQDRKPLTYTGLLRAAFVLGRKIAAMTGPGERVGILLPSSMGVVVTFYGLHA